MEGAIAFTQVGDCVGCVHHDVCKHRASFEKEYISTLSTAIRGVLGNTCSWKRKKIKNVIVKIVFTCEERHEKS